MVFYRAIKSSSDILLGHIEATCSAIDIFSSLMSTTGRVLFGAKYPNIDTPYCAEIVGIQKVDTTPVMTSPIMKTEMTSENTKVLDVTSSPESKPSFSTTTQITAPTPTSTGTMTFPTQFSTPMTSLSQLFYTMFGSMQGITASPETSYSRFSPVLYRQVGSNFFL